MGTDTNHTPPDDATTAEDRVEGNSTHDADRAPTPDEERAAESVSLDPDVAARHKEANERGAHIEGEGEIEA